MERMSDERMNDIRIDLDLHMMLQEYPARELLGALLAERAEVDRLRAERDAALAEVDWVRTAYARCERQDGDPTVEQVRLLADEDWVEPNDAMGHCHMITARALLRAWGEEA